MAVSRVMNEWFTPCVQEMLELADKEARRLNHECVGTEHILLALAEIVTKRGRGCDETHLVLNVLSRIGIGPSTIRDKVESLLSAGSDSVIGRMPQTPGVQNVLVLAVEEARKLQHNRVALVHILLGLMRPEVAYRVAGHVLRSILEPGFTVERVCQVVRGLLSTPPDVSKPDPTKPSEIPMPPSLSGPKCGSCVSPADKLTSDREALLSRCIADAERVLNHTAGGTAEELRNRVARGQAFATLAQVTAIALLTTAIAGATVAFTDAVSE